MNFEKSIHPLTEFLAENDFLVTKKVVHFIEYSSRFTIITIAYSNLENLFFTYAGEKSKQLIELTPSIVKGVFKDDSFQNQSTLTIDNLIKFLKDTGNSILIGEKGIFENIMQFTEKESKKYTEQLIQSQHIQEADKAWIKKDYSDFIKHFKMLDEKQLPASYLKKYRIAISKSQQ